MALQRGAGVLTARKLVLVLAGGAAALLLALGAGAAALVATAPGNRALRNWAQRLVERAVDGHVRLGSVGGALWRAVDVRDIELTMPDGAPAVRAERLTASFALVDLVRGRYRFSGVTLVRPVVVLEQRPDQRWNLEHLFKLVGGDSTGPRKKHPLVELRNVRLAGGTLIIKAHPAHDTAWTRTFTGITVDAARLRPSHPDSNAITLRLRGLAVKLDAPALDVRDARGDLALDGDSLRFDLEHVLLPGSHADLKGLLRWDGAHLKLDATVDATRLSFADLRGVAPKLPREGGGRARGRLQLPGDGGVSAVVADADLRTGRSAVQGKGMLTIGPRGGLSVRDADLTLQPFDLALLEPLVDSLPVRGLVRGHLRGTGSPRDLMVDADVSWTDESVAGTPLNHVSARGRLAFGGPAQLTFRNLLVRRADADLGTIRRFAAIIEPEGRLRAAGTLDGPWHAAQFSGTLEHGGPQGLASTVHGAFKLTLADTTVIDADLMVDSVSLALLRQTYAGIPLDATFRGRASLHGPVTRLAVDAALDGAPGHVTARGTIGALDSVVAVVLAGAFDSVNLAAARPGTPPSVLAGQWAVSLRVPVDQAQPSIGTVRLGLARGLVAGVLVGAARLALRLDRTSIEAESASVTFAGGSAELTGAIGRGNGFEGRARFALRSDTLGYLEPLLRWARRAAGDSSAVRLDGAGLLSGRVTGTVDSWAADLDFGVDGVTVGGSLGRGVRGRGRLSFGSGGYTVSAQATADTIAAAGLVYAPVGVQATGPLDSLSVRANGGFLAGSAVRSAFTVWGDTAARMVRVESLQVDLPVHSWRLVRAMTARVEPAAVVIDSLELRPEAGTGFVRARGALPRAGHTDFAVAADSVPVTDLYALAQRDTSGINGAMNGTLRVSGSAEDPTIELRVALAEGRFGDYRLPLFQVLARYADERLTLKGGLWRDSTRIVALSGSFPLDLSLRAVDERRLPGPISFVAQSDTLDMTVLDPLTDIVSGLSGQMGIDVRVGGSWFDASVSGLVDIRDGEMTIPAIGARYSGMDARLILRDTVVRVTRGQIQGGPGVVDISGSVNVRDLGRPVLDLTLRASRFAAFALPEFGELTGTGELHVRGPINNDTLTGHITVDEGYLQFADLVQKRVVSLDDPEFRALVDSNLARSANLGPSTHTVLLDSLRIDSLSVSMGSSVWLRSSEANIQLAGDFVVDKRIEDRLPRYRMDGTLRAVRGNYKLTLGAENSVFAVTRDFRVARGTVRFFGTPDFNPELDIAAEHTARTVQGEPFTVRALIGGTLLFPRLRLDSDHRPPLTETEIASYLMFGAPPSQASGGSGLGLSVAGSAIGGVGQALANDLGLPLSYLTVSAGTPKTGTQNGVTSARVEAGVQLSDRAFLTLNAGLCEVMTSPLPGTTLEWRFSSRWTASAAFEPVIQQCGTAAALAGLTGRYQLGFDLFWQQGIR